MSEKITAFWRTLGTSVRIGHLCQIGFDVQNFKHADNFPAKLSCNSARSGWSI